MLLADTDNFTNNELDNLTGTYFTIDQANRPPKFMARPINDSGQQINPKYDNTVRRDRLRCASAVAVLGSSRAVQNLPPAHADERPAVSNARGHRDRSAGLRRWPDDYFYAQDLNDNDQAIILRCSRRRVD